MAYDSKDNNKLGTLLKEKFGLEELPVAVKFYKTEAEVPEGISKIEEPLRHCEMITKSAREGTIFYSTDKEQKCKGGAGAIHINTEPVPEKILTGEFYYNLGRFESKEAGKKVADELPKLPEFNEAIVYAPLEKAEFEPDAVIVIAKPVQGMKLAQAIVYKDQPRVKADFSGIQSLCADAVSRPILTKTPNITLACDGSRNYAGIKEEQIIVGFAKENLNALLDAIESLYKE